MIYVFLGISSIIFYLYQAVNLFGGDSSEFSAISKIWGIPHPPGYPFYSLLLNLFRVIIPSVPLYIINNFFSYAPILVTAFFIYKILKIIKLSEFTSIFSSVFYLFLFPVWLYSEVTEVFTLNILIITLITYCLLMYVNSKKLSYKYLFFILFGLGLAHHHTFIILIPGWLYILRKNLKSFFIKNLLINILLISISLSFYIYAPIASFYKTPIDWENAFSFTGFFRLITRFSYGTFKAYASSTPNIINQFFEMISALLFIIKDFKPLGVIIICIGLLNYKKITKSFFNFIIINLFVYFAFIFFTNFVLSSSFVSATFERYLIGLYFLLIFPFAIGIETITDYFLKNISGWVKNSILKKIIKLSIYLFFIIYFLMNFNSSFKTISQLPKINQFDFYAKNILDTVPENSIISLNSDPAYFPTAYYYFTQNYRPDIIFVSYGLLTRDYYKERLRKSYPQLIIPKEKDDALFIEKFLILNSKKHDIFFEVPVKIGYWAPYGLLWKYYQVQDNINKDAKSIINNNNNLWNKVYTIPKIKVYQKDILYLDDLQKYYLNGLYNYSQFLIYIKHTSEAKKNLNKIIEYNSDFYQAKDLLKTVK